MGLVIFAVIGLFIVNLRRSTTGIALRAVRVSELASKTTGVSMVQMKVILAGLASFVAGVGGALLAITLGVGLPTNYDAVGGLVWLAVLVTQGVRSNMAARVGGIVFTLFPGLTSAYLPTWVDQIPTLLFGSSAIFLHRQEPRRCSCGASSSSSHTRGEAAPTTRRSRHRRSDAGA